MFVLRQKTAEEASLNQILYGRLESMACGVPVVCTRSGTKDLAVHRETAWVAWRLGYFIRRGVNALYTDPALAQKLRTTALERIERFSWPRVVDQLEDVVGKKLGTTK